MAILLVSVEPVCSLGDMLLSLYIVYGHSVYRESKPVQLKLTEWP